MNARRKPPGARLSLAPREHGAYGQLGMPLVAALAMGSPSVASILLTAAAVLAFVAHEPLLVVLGRRGPRARRNDGARAARVLAAFGGAAVVLGVLGLVLSPAEVRGAAALPLVLGALVLAFVAGGIERTSLGETVAAAALSSAAFPVAMAGGVGLREAAGAFIVWALSFSAATWAVRGVIAHARSHVGAAPRLFLVLAVPVALVAATATGLLAAPLALASAPMLLLAVGLAAAPPEPHRLRVIGFSLVGASVITTALLVAAARLFVE